MTEPNITVSVDQPQQEITPLKITVPDTPVVPPAPITVVIDLSSSNQ
jgi:hypothetical protein